MKKFLLFLSAIVLVILVSGGNSIYASTIVNTSDYAEIVNGSGYYLNVEGSRNNVRLNRVSVFYQDGTVGQQFKFTKSSHGYYLETKPVAGTSMAVNCECMEAFEGCKVDLFEPTGSKTQAWVIVPVDETSNKFYMKSADNENLCLTCDGRNDGNVYLAKFTGAITQQWAGASVSFSHKEEVYDKKITLYANSIPVNIYAYGDIKSVKSSNSKVVKIGKNNELIPMKKGTATITVKFNSTKEKIKVTVKNTSYGYKTVNDKYCVALDDAKIRSFASRTAYVVRIPKKDEMLDVKYSIVNSAGNLWYVLADGTYIYSDGVKPYTKVEDLKKVPGIPQQRAWSNTLGRPVGLCTIVSCYVMLYRRAIYDKGSTALSFADVNHKNGGSAQTSNRGYWETTNEGLIFKNSYWVGGYTYTTNANWGDEIHSMDYYKRLLKDKPEGVCLYARYSGGMHCILLSDYDETEDTFYVYDGVSHENGRANRIKLQECSFFTYYGYSSVQEFLNNVENIIYIESYVKG